MTGLCWRMCWTGLLALSWMIPSGAEAFERSRDPNNFACLWWDTRQVEIVLNQVCSDDVAEANCVPAIRRALDVWNEPACSDFQYLSALSARTDVGFDQDDQDSNINLIIFIEDLASWRHMASSIAITTTTYDRQTGQIVDTDVEFNGVNFTFSTSDSAVDRMDIENTLAHEAGHMLGLDHSSNPDATMWGTAGPGELNKRDLTEDDVDGLCHVYPAGEDLPACPGGPPPPDDGGCSAAGKSDSTSSLIGMAFLAYMFRRRRHADVSG